MLNLGGVGNVTWISDDPVEAPLAFDTGPGNALIDDWALHHIGVPVDRDGALARAGRVHGELVDAFRAHPFFELPAPKSLDRDDFTGQAVRGLSAADGRRHPDRLYGGGGGGGPGTIPPSRDPGPV